MITIKSRVTVLIYFEYAYTGTSCMEQHLKHSCRQCSSWAAHQRHMAHHMLLTIANPTLSACKGETASGCSCRTLFSVATLSLPALMTWTSCAVTGVAATLLNSGSADPSTACWLLAADDTCACNHTIIKAVSELPPSGISTRRNLTLHVNSDCLMGMPGRSQGHLGNNQPAGRRKQLPKSRKL